MDFDSYRKHCCKIVEEQDNRPVPEFEGYSPSEMHRIFYFTFEPGSPIEFNRLNDCDYEKIPIYNQIKYLLDLIEKKGELKLTDKGYLPPKIVAELYEQGFIKDPFVECGIVKMRREKDAMPVVLARILIELSGLVKK
jgi:hypothetical protein